MELDILTAVSPIDGRYRSKTEALAAYFSEYALMKYRVRVEIEYFSRFANCLCRSWRLFPTIYSRACAASTKNFLSKTPPASRTSKA